MSDSWAADRVALQDVGSGRVLEEVRTDRPVVDVCAFAVNGTDYVAMLTEAGVRFYKWAA